MRHLLPQWPDFLPQSWKINGLCLASRTVFAAVLLPWFLIGGLSKIGGLSLSIGPTVGDLPLSLGAYYAWLPGLLDTSVVGVPDFSLVQQVYVGMMVIMEVLLPLLIVFGFLTRSAVVLLVLHQTLFFVLSQPFAEMGAAFDASPFDMLPDQLLLWVMLLAPLALFGAGPVSVDAALGRVRSGPQSTL
jgi:uncharacterized membrane protein YphA (DoxX/SURF4 family)